MFKNFFVTLILGSISIFAADGFLCEIDPVFSQYMKGERSSLSGAQFYDDRVGCESGCAEYEECLYTQNSANSINLFSMAQSLSYDQAQYVEEIFNAGLMTNIYILKDQAAVNRDFLTPVNTSSWKFPTEEVTETAPIVRKRYSSGQGLDIELTKELSILPGERNYLGTSITPASLSSIWSMMSPGVSNKGITYFAIDGNKIDVSAEGTTLPYPSLPGDIYRNGSKYITMIAASNSCPDGGTLSGNTCTETINNSYLAVLNSGYYCRGDDDVLRGSICESYTRETVDGSWVNNVYTCPVGTYKSDLWCFKTYTHTYAAESYQNYSCPKGGTLSGTTCNTSSTTTYPATVTPAHIKYSDGTYIKEAFKGAAGSFVIGGYRYDTPCQYKANFSLSGTAYPMESGSYLDATGTLDIQKGVSATIKKDDSGYSCPLYGTRVDIGGDIAGNVFGSKYSCNSSCKTENPCVFWVDSECDIVGSEFSDPVTDYTGKTVFTKKIYSWKCDKLLREQVGCDLWEVSVKNGSLSYDLEGVGWEEKDFSADFGGAVAGTYMLEQMQHIWSGWEGYCEKGTKMDNSWMSDPMAILSMVMMLYGGAATGAYGETMQSAALACNDATTLMTGYDIGGYSQAATDASEGVNAATTAGDAASTWDTIKDLNTVVEVGEHTVKYTDFLAPALMAMSSVDEQDTAAARDYIQAATGGGGNLSPAAIRYAGCMSSIGLSFPDLVSHSAGVEQEGEPSLKKPWETPLRLTLKQIAEVEAVVGKTNREKYLAVIEDDGDIMTVIVASAAMKTQVGQIICAEKLEIAHAMNYFAQKSAGGGGGGGSGGEAAAMAVAQMVVGMLPPPWNLVGAVVLKIFTSVQSGNACSDEDMAQTWGIQQLKTNKAYKGGQCHVTRGDCVKEWMWGDCMLSGEWSCCYDQEITRIFVEGMKVQLGYGWGSCNDLTINDLKNISFRPCKLGENPKVHKCFPSAGFSELKATLMKQATKGVNMDRMTDQVENSLTLPGQNVWE